MTEYWYARRFPVGHWRNAMGPISPKAKRVTWALLGGFGFGLSGFFILGLAGNWQLGVLIFAVIAGAGSWYYFFEPIRRFDRFHTVEDYRMGRVRHDGQVVAPEHGKFSLAEKFSAFSEHWRPRTVAELNGQELKLVKIRGEFPWHSHEDADEMFLVWKGEIRLEFRDRSVMLANLFQHPAERWVNLSIRPGF